jgi:hypothetical protein
VASRRSRTRQSHQASHAPAQDDRKRIQLREQLDPLVLQETMASSRVYFEGSRNAIKLSRPLSSNATVAMAPVFIWTNQWSS